MAIRKKINFMPCRWLKKGAFVTFKNQFFDKLMKMSLSNCKPYLIVKLLIIGNTLVLFQQ